MLGQSTHATKTELIEQFAAHVRAYQAAAEVFQEAAGASLGLNRTDQHCLEILERRGPLSAGKLAAAAGLSTKAITTAIDRLERAGFARRIADADDRRRVLVAITDDGHRRGEAVYEPLVSKSKKMLERFTRAELQLLADYLDQATGLLRARAGHLGAQVSIDTPAESAQSHEGGRSGP